jgi:hypothetical protein
MGRLVLAQIKADPNNPTLSPIRIAMQGVGALHTLQQHAIDEVKICEAAADYLCWKPDHTIDLVWTANTQWNAGPEDSASLNKQNMLSVAIITGDVPLVQQLLRPESDIQVNFESPYFGRPLNLAARWGHMEILRFLLRRNANTQALQRSVMFYWGREGGVWGTYGSYYSSHGSALRAASLAGHIDIVRILMEPKYRISYVGEFYEVLLAAGRAGHVHIIRVLLEMADGLDLQQEGRWFYLLLEACKHGRPDVAEMVLAENRVDVNRELTGQQKYRSPIQFVSWMGHASTLRVLINHGVNLDFTRYPLYFSRDSPIILAITKGHIHCARLLLSYGVDMTDYNVAKRLLETAINHRQVPIVKLLLALGIELNSSCPKDGSKLGDNMLVKAVRCNLLAAINLLILLGVPPNNSNQNLDPVLCANIHGLNHALKTLFDLGATDIDVETSIFASQFSTGEYPIKKKTPSTLPSAKGVFKGISVPESWSGRDF